MRRVAQRYLGFAVLLTMAALAAVGYVSIRRDVENLRVISQDNILWTAMQMEIELLRFQLSVADLQIEASDEALQQMRNRFEILWSRIFMMGPGRVGELIRDYDSGHDTIANFQSYMKDLDPIVAAISPDATVAMAAISDDLTNFQKDLRAYSMRVVRGDTAAAALVRDRIQRNSQTTMIFSVGALLLSVLALALILRENRRQRQIAELNRSIAVNAERSTRAKSRFLAMMSHELRNPLNGVLGPLALLGQTEIPSRHHRLVAQARQSGKSMVQMLSGLLDYGEMQDGCLSLRVEPMRLSALLAGISLDLRDVGAEGVVVRSRHGSPIVVSGDFERFRSIFVNLVEYVLENSQPDGVEIMFSHEREHLIGEISFSAGDAAIDWKFDLLTGLNESEPEQVSSDALRPLIARGLITAARGVLSLIDGSGGRRGIRVALPAPAVRFERIRVRLETRSAALAAIYQAALRSDRIVFVGDDASGPVDMVLVDATSVGEGPLMGRLRARYPDALFVSLGAPASSDGFDEVVDGPADMARLRSQILGRLTA